MRRNNRPPVHSNWEAAILFSQPSYYLIVTRSEPVFETFDFISPEDCGCLCAESGKVSGILGSFNTLNRRNELGHHHGCSAEVFLLQEELKGKSSHSDSWIGCELFFRQIG